MKQILQTPIPSTTSIGFAFSERGCLLVSDAVLWVRGLPYRRNENPGSPLAVLEEGCGTCSTKHGLLFRLLTELTDIQQSIQLVVGIFQMSVHNTPKIGPVLAAAGLNYMPEAHCYLRIGGSILDATNLDSNETDFLPWLETETVITPNDLPGRKVALHREYLADWLARNPALPVSTLEELWAVREACIRALAT